MRNSRIAELTATSEISFDEALRQGIEKAAETLDNIEIAFVKDPRTGSICSSVIARPLERTTRKRW